MTPQPKRGQTVLLTTPLSMTKRGEKDRTEHQEIRSCLLSLFFFSSSYSRRQEKVRGRQ